MTGKHSQPFFRDMVRDNPERLLGTRPAHGVSSPMAHGSQNTDHGWKRNSLATTAHRRLWGQWRESDLQIAEWHGNTVHAFALAGAGAADYVKTVLIGTLNGAQVDSKSEKST